MVEILAPARMEKNQGPRGWVPCSFRGIVRGKRFMVEGGLGSFSGFSFHFSVKPKNK
jgi:hypothetical protein